MTLRNGRNVAVYFKRVLFIGKNLLYCWHDYAYWAILSYAASYFFENGNKFYKCGILLQFSKLEKTIFCVSFHDLL